MNARIVNLIRQQAVQNLIEDEIRSIIQTSRANFFLYANLHSFIKSERLRAIRFRELH